MDNLDVGLHELMGDDFLLNQDDVLFNENGLIGLGEFPEIQPEEDYLTTGLAAFVENSLLSDEDPEQELLPPDHSFMRAGMRASYSMNDLQSMVHPPANLWNSRLVSVKPTLQSVPEGLPASGGNFNLMPILPASGYDGGGLQQQQQQQMQQMQQMQQQVAMPLNLPPLQSYQHNYSYVQYAGAPTRSGGMASSSESGQDADNGEEHQSTDGQQQSAAGASMMRNSYPSMGNLSAQMNNQLQIKRQNSEDNFLGLGVITDGSGGTACAEHMDMRPAFHQGSTVTTCQQPIVPQKSQGPSKQYVPFMPAASGFMAGGQAHKVMPPIASMPMQSGSALMMGNPSLHPQQQQQQQLQQQHPGGAPPMPLAVSMLRQAPSGAPLRKTQSALELVSWRNTSGDLDFWDPSGSLAEQLHGMHGVKVGRLTPEERLQKILRYRQKRQERNFNRTIKYQCRKSLADTRPRVRGRFARNNDIGIVMPHETKKAQRERLAQAQEAGADVAAAVGGVLVTVGATSSSPSSSSGGVPLAGSHMHAEQQPQLQQVGGAGYAPQEHQMDLLGQQQQQGFQMGLLDQQPAAGLQQQQQQHYMGVLQHDPTVKQEDSLDGVFNQWSASDFMNQQL